MGNVKNWTVEKKDEIETILINMWASLGMDIPNNYEDIVQYCYEDVCETADPIHWSNSDVAIAFRRWIEAQAKENVQNGETLSPIHNNLLLKDQTLDGIYGVKLNTIGELRCVMSELSDDDLICIETIDTETNDTQDLYPMYVDVIEGIELNSGKNVNEVRFCQMPNSKPDTRDKQPLVDKVISMLKYDIANGDETVLDELLMKLPWEILKGSLPEELWKQF